MSKTYRFDLGPIQEQKFFAPVRNKVELLLLLFEAIKFIHVSVKYKPKQSSSKMILNVSKMSRLFFFKEKKSFSIVLPFNVSEGEDGNPKFSARNYGAEIDSEMISRAISILSDSNSIHSNCVTDFADRILEFSIDEPGFWEYMRELLLMEGGYLRYDHDPERENGTVHPLHHLDVFYSSDATSKIGLNRQIDDRTFIDIVDIETACHYLVEQ